MRVCPPDIAILNGSIWKVYMIKRFDSTGICMGEVGGCIWLHKAIGTVAVPSWELGSPPPLPLTSVSPRNQWDTLSCGWGYGGGPNSDDLRKGLFLCLLCVWLPNSEGWSSNYAQPDGIRFNLLCSVFSNGDVYVGYDIKTEAIRQIITGEKVWMFCKKIRFIIVRIIRY
jgi:hypothetical protein